MFWMPNSALTLALTLATALAFPSALVAGEAAKPPATMFVHASRTDLRAAPDTKAKALRTLSRGDSVKVLEAGNVWAKVEIAGVEGWVSKVFLTPTKPVGKAELSNEVGDSVEKSSRRRPSSYNVSAATRGLDGDAEVKDGKTLYKTDYDAVERIEKRKVAPGDVDRFRDAAKLPK